MYVMGRRLVMCVRHVMFLQYVKCVLHVVQHNASQSDVTQGTERQCKPLCCNVMSCSGFTCMFVCTVLYRNVTKSNVM